MNNLSFLLSFACVWLAQAPEGHAWRRRAKAYLLLPELFTLSSCSGCGWNDKSVKWIQSMGLKHLHRNTRNMNETDQRRARVPFHLKQENKTWADKRILAALRCFWLWESTRGERTTREVSRNPQCFIFHRCSHSRQEKQYEASFLLSKTFILCTGRMWMRQRQKKSSFSFSVDVFSHVYVAAVRGPEGHEKTWSRFVHHYFHLIPQFYLHTHALL